MKYIFYINRENNQKPYEVDPQPEGGNAIYFEGWDKFTLTKEQALELLPKLYPGHDTQYIDLLPDSQIVPETIPYIEEWAKQNAPYSYSQLISNGREARVVNLQVKGNETWLWLRIYKENEIDNLIYLLANNSGSLIDTATMNYIGSQLVIDVSDYTETTEHNALQYLTSKGAGLFPLYNVMISKRDQDGTIDQKLSS